MMKIMIIKIKKKKIKNNKIPLLGLHNIRNATAAVAVATIIGISAKIINQIKICVT